MILSAFAGPVLTWFGNEIAGKSLDEAVKRLARVLSGDKLARAIKKAAKSEHFKFNRERLDSTTVERLLRFLHESRYDALQAYIFGEARLVESNSPDVSPVDVEMAKNRVTVAVMTNVENAIRSDEKLYRQYDQHRQQLIYKYVSEMRAGMLKNFHDMMRLGALADSCITRKVRQLESVGHAHADPVRQAYSEEVRQSLKSDGFDETTFLKAIHDVAFLANLSQSVGQPVVRTTVEKGFSKLVFAWSGKTKTIDDPRLLWDCCCRPDQPPDRTRCRIHKDDRDGDDLEVKFLAPQAVQEIICPELAMIWRNDAAVWPPSIDAFGMLKDLTRAGMRDWGCTRIADVGCGTGFLGLAIANANQNVTHVGFSDWLVTPIVLTALNWHRSCRANVEASFHLDLYSHWIESSDDFDCLLCNPPYLPLNDDARELGLTQAVAGTSLLENVIEESCDLARRVFVSFSILAEKEARDAAERAGRSLKRITKGRRIVPFRIRGASSKGYLEFLRKRGLETDPQGQYQFCHEVATFEVVD